MTFSVRRNCDLLLLVVGAASLAVAALVVPIVAVKVICAIPLALVLPGYALALALFARTQMEIAARLLLSSGLSLAVCVLGGMLIDELPGGIDRTNWAWLLVLVTLLGSVVAWVRRSDGASPIAQRLAAGNQVRSSWRIPRVRPASVVIFCVAVAVAAGALIESRRAEPARLVNGYESFSLTNTDDGRGVSLVLTSVRQHPANYRVTASVGGRSLVDEELRLAAGQRVVVKLPLGTSEMARQFKASARLIDRSGGPWTPRTLSVRVPASSATPGGRRQSPHRAAGVPLHSRPN